MDQYNALRKKLNEEHQWPSVYLFKFIVPDTPELLAKVQTLFTSEAIISYKKSKSGKYISVSVLSIKGYSFFFTEPTFS